MHKNGIIITYTIQVCFKKHICRHTPNNTVLICNKFNTTKTTYVLKDLKPNWHYIVSVCAWTSKGAGRFSKPINIITKESGKQSLLLLFLSSFHKRLTLTLATLNINLTFLFWPLGFFLYNFIEECRHFVFIEFVHLPIQINSFIKTAVVDGHHFPNFYNGCVQTFNSHRSSLGLLCQSNFILGLT